LAKKRIKQLGVLTLLIIFSCQFTLIDNTQAALPMEGISIILLFGDDFDYWQLFPYSYFEELGYTIHLVCPTATVTSGSTTKTADFLISEMTNVSDYDMVYVPGCVSETEHSLCSDQDAIDLIDEAYSEGLILAGLDSGPLLFAEADIILGKNISCRSDFETEIEAAGGNYVEGDIIFDEQFVTASYDFINDFMILGIIKALGLYETNAPTISNFDTEITTMDSKGTIAITVDIEEEFLLILVEAEIYKYNTETSQYNKLTEKNLAINEETYQCTGSFANLDVGNYSITINTEDYFENEGTYSDYYRFYIGSTESVSLNILYLLFGFSGIVILFINRKRKAESV
jgi:protease I